jgi:hypothetical protein
VGHLRLAADPTEHHVAGYVDGDDAGHFLQEHRPQQLADIILGLRAAGGR